MRNALGALKTILKGQQNKDRRPFVPVHSADEEGAARRGFKGGGLVEQDRAALLGVADEAGDKPWGGAGILPEGVHRMGQR